MTGVVVKGGESGFCSWAALTGQLALALLETCSGTIVELETQLREGPVEPGPKLAVAVCPCWYPCSFHLLLTRLSEPLNEYLGWRIGDTVGRAVMASGQEVDMRQSSKAQTNLRHMPNLRLKTGGPDLDGHSPHGFCLASSAGTVPA